MNYQQHLANSAAIRSEIQRFESVHPNIYSIYELLERVEEPLLQNQIREHVIAIEGKTDTKSHFPSENTLKKLKLLVFNGFLFVENPFEVLEVDRKRHV